MNKIQTLIIAIGCSCLSWSANAQVVSEVVSIQPGYTNQVFYNMNSGELSNITHTDWDIAFQLRGFAASILINSKNNVRLWKANKDISQWSTMLSSDTTGVVNNPAFELMNSDTSWDFGAFNVTNDATNAFDLGWGTYDFVTHIIYGDSVYFIKVGATDYRKIKIESLSSGTYNFRFANLDGSNEIVVALSKSAFQGKFFAYYSLLNNLSIDREPVYNAWDLTFCQYLAINPVMYKVTGVLSNDSVFVEKAYPVDVNTANSGAGTLAGEINAIGYDWKAFDLNSSAWIISDSLVYFVTDRQNAVWKMVFTGFDGATTGNFYFDKSPAVASGLIENSTIKTFGLYPNPAHDNVRMMLQMEQPGNTVISIIDVKGSIAYSNATTLRSGLQSVDLDISELVSGLYQIVVRQGNEIQTSRLLVD
ncbi:MAG: T9SS type A sorting domain-containing protein [Bacteroidia bacterium]|nr:T9SS type A sorting domain-containing protein [Bacteroidota bacterium]MBP6511348.1 T9SS type A sorting domain-containing protein [Bacteroidia bacterium]MBP7244055.1 T9SS type A sorting domain-containing protein [Bacteroidia bacterium]